MRYSQIFSRRGAEAQRIKGMSLKPKPDPQHGNSNSEGMTELTMVAGQVWLVRVMIKYFV